MSRKPSSAPTIRPTRLAAQLPLGPALKQSIKFFGVVIAGNVVALLLLLVPGVNIAAFFIVNGYLLGREFFEFAAMRHRPRKRKPKAHCGGGTAGTVFLAGLLIAAFISVPLLTCWRRYSQRRRWCISTR